MDDQRDFGIAVTNAKRLNDCWHELHEAFAARPSVEGDPAMWFTRASASPGNEDWVHDVNSRNVAEVTIRDAILNRAFPIWLRLADGEVLADPNAIGNITHRTLVTGVYLTHDFRPSYLEGRPLWVKDVDWRRILTDTLKRRYGDANYPGGPTWVDEEFDPFFAEPAASDGQPLNVDGDMAQQGPPEFDRPQRDWVELWRGPMEFRATYDKGKFGPGHSLDDINKFGQGRSKDRELFVVRIDPEDSAVVIEWQTRDAESVHPNRNERMYESGFARGRYNQLRDDPAFRKRALNFLPPELRDRALGAYATAASMREWVEREFFTAVHAGQCEIWARAGSRTASFRRVPPDIFGAYKITKWGYGQPGAGSAELDGEPPLFAVHVAPTVHRESSGTSPQVVAVARAPAVKAGRAPSDDEILSKADEMKGRGMTGCAIAKMMRLEVGFENVATTMVRELVKGRWKSTGRPKNGA